MINFQLSLQCDSEIIASIFMTLRNLPRTTTFQPASLPTRDCVQNWNKQLSAGEINGTYTSSRCDVSSEPAKLPAQLRAHVCVAASSCWKRMFLSKQHKLTAAAKTGLD